MDELRLGCKRGRPEGVFLKSQTHPRAYGNFARLLGQYVRDEQAAPLQDASAAADVAPGKQHRDQGARISSRPAMAADVVLFEPATIADHATFEKPMQLATGVDDVFINGVQVLKDGKPHRREAGPFR